MFSPTLVVSDFNLACTAIAGFIVIFGLVSLQIRERFYLSMVTLATLFGILVGNQVAGLVNASHWDEHALDVFTFQASRVLIAISVMIAGIELPGRYLLTEFKSLAVMLSILMGFKWIVTAFLLWGILHIAFIDALIVSAAVTPTDPVLANAIVKGRYAEKHVPEHLRLILTAESGANDGLGFPFLFIALYLKVYPSTGEALVDWLLDIVLYRVVLGTILGAIIGWAAKKALQFCTNRNYIDKPSFLAFGVALAIFILGFVGMLGSDELLAVFIAGNTLTSDDWYRKEHEEEHLQATVDDLLTCSFFVFFGAQFPWHDLGELFPWWKLILVCISILVLSRLPWMLCLYRIIPAVKTPREAIFSGWFGPMGVSALYYAYLLKEDVSIAPKELANMVIPLVSLIVFASVITHGMSIAFFKVGRKVQTTSIAISRTLSNSIRPRSPRSDAPIAISQISSPAPLAAATSISIVPDMVHERISSIQFGSEVDISSPKLGAQPSESSGSQLSSSKDALSR